MKEDLKLSNMMYGGLKNFKNSWNSSTYNNIANNIAKN